MRTILLCTTIAAAASFGLTSASADDSNPENVIVTATRIPTPQAQIASSVTVVTSGQIAARQEQTLPEVLKDVPGVNVVQTGGPGGQTSVFMRGTNSNHVKVLIDGIDVSDPSSPNAAFDFGQVLTPDIAKVEVLRGPQSGVYGSDAIGGVINIITKSGSGPAQFTASAEGGSFATFNQAAGVSGSTGGFHYAANIEHFYSGATPVTPEDLLLPGEKRHDDKYNNVTASTKLGYDVSDDFDVGLVARYTNSRIHLTGTDFNLFPSPPDATQSEGNTLQYDTRGTAHLVLFGGVLDQTVGLAYSSIRSNDYSPDGPASPSSGNRIKLDWQGNVRLSGDETLVLGAEHERDDIDVPVSANIAINSAYAELQSSFGPNFSNAANIRYDDNDHFGAKVTYRLAPTYTLEAIGIQFKASVGTGFKAPTLEELFENFPSFGFFANPNLKPETSIGYDIGFEQPLWGDKLRFGATYFRNNIRNLIDDNATFTSYANVGRAETDGVESFVSYRPLEQLTLRADYTYTEANDEITHQELLRRPKQKVNLDANWQATAALSFNANLLYVGSWTDGNRDFSILRLRAPGYTTANIAANYDINENFSVYGRVDNLLDEKYQNPVGFLQPGRGFFAGIKAKI